MNDETDNQDFDYDLNHYSLEELLNLFSLNKDSRNDDILYWPSKKDSIDLEDYLTEILLVEVPFKKLCSVDCKGICIKCGSNRNVESCLCKKNK